ncbi:ABC transporter ATP-binding protein [Methanolobus sp.]|jgi:ABC-2 type transport system ATP-binding protein|uniref:ABC transporter ATP-binding protein n=1 Tax=Methanolobus sp. TaxID=1874737 RepID=UPI0025D86FD7|nr:ABC transporter ATP-binding protein [Methanolobus sp.]
MIEKASMNEIMKESPSKEETSFSSFVVDVRNLAKRYGDFAAVNDLTLQVKKGEIFGFLGHNGAGKTTTINMLTTLLEPSSGSGKVAGYDIINESLEVRRRIGYLPENVQFYDSMTAYENLEYFAKLSGIKKPDSQIWEVLDFLDARSYADKKISALSKGMRQRIGIAQAIIHEPEILFLDEPTTGLDPFGVKQLRDIILRLNSQKGITIFMNTHLLQEVTKTCSTIGVLNHGSLIYLDSLSNTMKRFKDEGSLEDIYLNIENNEEE